MDQIILDAEAKNVSAELSRRGVAADTRVHVVINILGTEALPMAMIAQAGRAFDWLDEEPDLYADSDLLKPAR